MKKLIAVLFIIFTMISTAYAENKLNFDGKEYYLRFSEKSAEHNGFYNQYYKAGEDMDNWTEMVAVHHFPNVFSPIEQAYNFREYLESFHCPSSLEADEENNTGMLDFILIDGHQLPIVLEFNIFKYEKSKNCGTIAFQYAKKFQVYDNPEVAEVKKKFSKFRPRAMKKINDFEIPDVVEIKLNDLP